MAYSDNPMNDFYAHERELERRSERLPHCVVCGDPIFSDKAVFYNDEWYCEDCEDEFYHSVRDDFLQTVEEE